MGLTVTNEQVYVLSKHCSDSYNGIVLQEGVKKRGQGEGG